MTQIKFTILISTKNRRDDLVQTLDATRHLFNKNVVGVVYDDGSSDGTYELVKKKFPEIVLLRNQISKGYLYCRNKMLNETAADFAISLDDDAQFLAENPIEIITDYFANNATCGVIAARIFWGKGKTENNSNNGTTQKVKSYIGCGHVWRMSAWRDIPNYPEWFEFYGEENFASFQLLKKRWEVHYVPELFVQHRVDLKNRTQTNNDFAFRYRRSLRADWCNYFLFFPASKIPRTLGYSIWIQFKNKIFKGNVKVIVPLLLALLDLILAVPKLISNRNALTSKEYSNYLKLKETKIYWKPEN